MSEALMSVQYAQFAVEATQPDYEINNRMRITALVACGAFALASCSSGAKEALTASTASSTAAVSVELAAASQACGETIDTSANSANKHYGSPESIFPSLEVTNKTGQAALLPTTKAAVAVREQLTHDNRALGIFSAYLLETRKTQQLPTTGTLDRAKELIKTYGANPTLAEQALTDSCNSLAFLKPETKFGVTRGQAMAVETVRDAQGNIIGFKTETINATENLKGFVLDYNHDDKSLTDVQKAIYDKLSKLILITADGKIVINETFGPSSFDVTQNAPQTPVSIKTTGTTIITVKPFNTPGQVPAGISQSNSQISSNSGSAKASGGSNTTGNGGGVKVGQQGCGTGGVNCGGGSGSNTGNQGPTGPGAGGGGSTPVEAPPVANQPPVVVVPPVEKPPVVVPPVEVPPPVVVPPVVIPPPVVVPPPVKGTQPPCVSNPPYVVC
jgi:hypothetical protein